MSSLLQCLKYFLIFYPSSLQTSCIFLRICFSSIGLSQGEATPVKNVLYFSEKVLLYFDKSAAIQWKRLYLLKNIRKWLIFSLTCDCLLVSWFSRIWIFFFIQSSGEIPQLLTKTIETIINDQPPSIWIHIYIRWMQVYSLINQNTDNQTDLLEYSNFDERIIFMRFSLAVRTVDDS